MQKKLVTAAALAVFAALAAAAFALGAAQKSHQVSAALSAKAEVPAPKGVPAGAKGAFTGAYTGSKLTWKLSFSGLSGAAAAAHIHKGKPGTAGSVIVPLCGPCKSGQSGSATISKDVISALASGGAYVNVHTAKNGNGEIRGQIKVKG